ncbi:CueP family metal-binding protein [Leucobacter sp. gxy201]|uniref:CueP family metal-binding protein n=1 Tax=Leucobacter sp. gxy201 TaxID=2957200 RepID=UPI003DA02E3A
MGIGVRFAPLIVAAALLLSGCAAGTGGAAGADGPESSDGPAAPAGALPSPADALQQLGLSGDDPRGIVDALDALPLAERPDDLIVSVLPNALRVQPDQPDELVLPLEAGEFYLSIAPYRDQTHPCTFHSLTTCVGEMRSAEVGLRITDAATGELIVDRRTRTADNGFVGVWLPADRELEVEITAESAAGTEAGRTTVTTGAGDPTCLTTIRLT